MNDTQSQILATLQAICADLRSLNTKLDNNSQTVGFGPAPVPRRVYIGGPEDEYPWYFWDHQSEKPVPIGQNALTGILTGLKPDDRKEYKGKKVWKLLVDVQAERPYRIESGISTLFSKGLMLAIAKLTPDQLQQPLTIAVVPGEEALFCRLYLGSQPIKTDWPENPEEGYWQSALKQAVAKVEQASKQR